MKHIKRINESSSPEEMCENSFKEAHIKGRSKPNLDYLGSAWKTVSNKYHLYDDYYLYEDSILEFRSYDSGNWYGYELKRLDTPPHVFKEKIYNRIEALEKAFNKL